MSKRFDLALGPHSDYRYDKQYWGGRGGRRNQQRYSDTVSRLIRRRGEREWKRDLRAE